MSHLRSITPNDLLDESLTLVPRGARGNGVEADAVWAIDDTEHTRRTLVGSGPVADLSVLDALMTLPLGLPVPQTALDGETIALLNSAPPGALRWTGDGVTRLIVPPGEVAAAFVSASSWRRAMRTAACLTDFCQTIIIVPAFPQRFSQLAWEASAAGIGVWRTSGAGYEEALAPVPYVRRFWKPATWRFIESAYAEWLSATYRRASSVDRGHRHARTTIAAPGLF